MFKQAYVSFRRIEAFLDIEGERPLNTYLYDPGESISTLSDQHQNGTPFSQIVVEFSSSMTKRFVI